MVEILLGRDDANPEKPDEDNQLCPTNYNGHEGILPGRGDVNPVKRRKLG